MLKDLLKNKKLFIFDLDGTVTDTEPLHRLSYARTLEKLCPGHTMEHNEFLENYVGHSETNIYETMRKKKGAEFDDKEFFETRIDELFEIVKETKLETAAFFQRLCKEYPECEFIALTSQRESVLERFRALVDYKKIKRFISVADKPYGKREVLADTEKYLGYKQEECVIFEDYYLTLRYAMENNVLAVGVKHTLNKLSSEDCDVMINIDD